MSWVAKFQGGKKFRTQAVKEQSQSYREIKLLVSAGKEVVANFPGDKSASHLP